MVQIWLDVLFGSRQEPIDHALQKLKEENSSWEVDGKFPKLAAAADRYRYGGCPIFACCWNGENSNYKRI